METAVSHSSVVEKLVEIPESEYFFKVFTRQGGGGLAGSEGAIDDEEFFVVEGSGWCSS